MEKRKPIIFCTTGREGMGKMGFYCNDSRSGKIKCKEQCLLCLDRVFYVKSIMFDVNGGSEEEITELNDNWIKESIQKLKDEAERINKLND